MRGTWTVALTIIIAPLAAALPVEPEIWDCAPSNSFFPGQYFDLGASGGVAVHLRLDVPPAPIFGDPGPLMWIVMGDENSLYMNQERHMYGAWIENADGRLFQTYRADATASPGVHAGEVDVRAPGVWCGGADHGAADVPLGEYRVVMFAASDMGSSMGLSIANEATILSVQPLPVLALFDDELDCASSLHVSTGLGAGIVGDVRSYTDCEASFTASSGFCELGRVGQEPSATHEARWDGPNGERITLDPQTTFRCEAPGTWTFEVPQYGTGLPGDTGAGITSLAVDVPPWR